MLADAARGAFARALAAIRRMVASTADPLRQT
jgi:hypothetical protein